MVAFVRKGGKQQFSPIVPEQILVWGARLPLGPGQQKEAVTLVQSQAMIVGLGLSFVTPILQLTVYPLGPLPGPMRFSGKFRLFAVQFGGLCAAARFGRAIDRK